MLKRKIGDILKRIVDFVSKYFKGDKANGLLKHNEYAQAFLDNSEKLQQMAEIISRASWKRRDFCKNYCENFERNSKSFAHGCHK